MSIYAIKLFIVASDFNKDGKKDLIKYGVFASAANGTDEFQVIENDKFARGNSSIEDKLQVIVAAKRVDVNKKISEWAKMGVRNLDGSNLPEVDIDAYLVYPEGVDGRKFIVYENFKTILKWNRSLFFGLAVGRLSDLIEYY